MPRRTKNHIANHKSTASPDKIEELKTLINNGDYMKTSIEHLADRLSKSVEFKENNNQQSCVGVNCDDCINRKKCKRIINKVIVSRKIEEKDFVDTLLNYIQYK